MINDTNVNPETLAHNWTAEVKLQNDQIITIWHTAWHSTKDCIKEILSISSDLPKCDKRTYPYKTYL